MSQSPDAGAAIVAPALHASAVFCHYTLSIAALHTRYQLNRRARLEGAGFLHTAT